MKLFFVLLAAFSGLAVFLLFFQHRLIYFPRNYNGSPQPPDVLQLNYGLGPLQQTSYYMARGDQQTPRRIWLIVGGNASLALDWLSFARRFPDRHTAFLLFDYPGYGKCTGKASPKTILASLDLCLAALSTELHLTTDEIVERMGVLGHSLGSAVALRLALRYRIKHLILISPFTSMLEMAKRAVPFPFYHLLLHRFDNKAALAALLDAPEKPSIVILHGDHDEIVPVEMARSLATTYRNELEYIEIDGVDHNSIIDVAESEIHQLMAAAQ